MAVANINDRYLRQITETRRLVDSMTPLLIRSMRTAESAVALHRHALGHAAPMIEASLALKQITPDVRPLLGVVGTAMIQHATVVEQIANKLIAGGVTQAAAEAQNNLVQVVRDIRRISTPVVDVQSVFQQTAPVIARVTEDIRRMILPAAAEMQVLGHQLEGALNWVRRLFPTVWIRRSPFDCELSTAAWADEVDPFSLEVDRFLMQHFGDLIYDRNDLTYARFCFTRSIAPRVRYGEDLHERQVRLWVQQSIQEGRHQVARLEGAISPNLVTADPYGDLELRLLVEQFLDTIPDLDRAQRAAMLDLLDGYRWSEALRLHGVNEAGRKKVQRSARGFALFIGRPDLLKRGKNQLH